MARALARGWNRPVLVADPVAERAQSLVAEVGGEVLAGNGAVAERADLVVLCHKPAQLADVAQEVAPHAKAVASILAATSLAALHDAYPDRPVYRFIPSLPVEVREGAVVQAAPDDRYALDAPVAELFAELGTLVTLARRARRRRDGLDVVCPRLRGARRRGADRRGCAPRHSRRRRALSWSYRHSPGPPSCCAVVATTHSPSAARWHPRAESPLAASRPWSAPGCARPSATPSMRFCLTGLDSDDPCRHWHPAR